MGALANTTTSSNNTADGYGALSSNIDGAGNTAMGAAALYLNGSGSLNTAVGASALFTNSTGHHNTGIGNSALLINTTGYQNTALGYFAMANSSGGHDNVSIGYQAGISATTGSNNVHIGNQGTSADNGTIRIGTAGVQTSFYVGGVRGVTTGNGDAVNVVIDSNGQLGTVSSSRRFKEDIQDMGDASRGLMDLRPVMYRYQKPYSDGSKPLQYGLIAEEVAEVYPDLVAHSADGQIETVKYQVLDSMLLNEVQRQQAEISKQIDQIQVLQQQINELKALLTSGKGSK
jgi:hypothetical protein